MQEYPSSCEQGRCGGNLSSFLTLFVSSRRQHSCRCRNGVRHGWREGSKIRCGRRIGFRRNELHRLPIFRIFRFPAGANAQFFTDSVVKTSYLPTTASKISVPEFWPFTQINTSWPRKCWRNPSAIPHSFFYHSPMTSAKDKGPDDYGARYREE